MSALSALARHMGIVPSYLDQTGRTRDTSDETARILLAAMGVAAGDDAVCAASLARIEAEAAARLLPQWIVAAAGTVLTLPPLDGHDWLLAMEDGGFTDGRGSAVGIVPLGIHRLDADRHTCWILAAPTALPEAPLGWGVTLPLYGLKPAAMGGIGDYADLARAMTAIAATGAGFAGVNPIHAGFPADPGAFSPYAPSSRRRHSTLHIAAGATAPPADMVDYAAVQPAQAAALEVMVAAAMAAPDPAFADWRTAQGHDLELFALHQALSEAHGPYWPHWPEALHDSDGTAARDFAEIHAERVTCHALLQWIAEEQLAGVRRAADGMAQGLYLDLAVGTHPEGAETWAAPHLFAHGVSLGAPPDGFSADGQRWNLAPLLPSALADDGFRPLAAILAAQFRHARLLRIDHILGFERAFWVPPRHLGQKVPGAYVTMPKAALLAVARIEAARVGGHVIGEDLGNIPEGLGADMAASGLLGCRVVAFEHAWQGDTVTFKPAADYDRHALASFGTHDLPTWLGWRSGLDLDWRHRLGSMDDATTERARVARAAEVAALDALLPGTSVDDMHRFVAAAPSRLVAVQIEDALHMAEQPNLPGTTDEHPNWRRRLPVPPSALGDALTASAAIMTSAGR